ncbi:MAG: class I SAM-dependent methyltransferase [bacterium]|nr:class I SAM-dependent methyltransferase [bacterium]
MDNTRKMTGIRMNLHKTLKKLIDEPEELVPWRDGVQIPWDDPEFSKRMLEIHLDQSTNAASRSIDVIEQHTNWLLEQCLLRLGKNENLRILDVSCGPGLYLFPLAEKGHDCVGFDFAPAPIEWAKAEAAKRNLDCAFHKMDLTKLTAEDLKTLGEFDVITFWFGEIHTFEPETTKTFLKQLSSLLKPNGLFILEYQHYDLYPKEDLQEWQPCDESVLYDKPHLWLRQYRWDDELQAEIAVHWVIDSETGESKRYAQSSRAYQDQELVDLLFEAGLSGAVLTPPITGVDEQYEFSMVVTQK